MEKMIIRWIVTVILVACALAVILTWINQQERERKSYEEAIANGRAQHQADNDKWSREYNALLHAKTAVDQDRDDLKQLVTDLSTKNVVLQKQRTAARNRPTTFTVYQEAYPGSPIAKSPIALRFSEEGILRTACGRFIFRARH